MRSVFGALVFVVACGGGSGDGVAAPPSGALYGNTPNTTVVVGPGSAPGNGTVVTTPSGEQCVTLSNGACVKPQDKCKTTERADVVIDASGKVLEIICYPSTTTPIPSDGRVHGNNVTIFGNGPDSTIIATDLSANGNNFSARGVTVKGNVTIDGNNATLVLCVVDGDVIVKGNNVVVAGCTISGQIRVDGNNAIIVGNKVTKGIDAGDHNATCDGNVDAANASIACGDSK